MKIVRIYNNNVVVTNDEKENEMIVIGKGIAFQKKINDSLDEKKIEKIFTLQDKTVMSKLEILIQDIPSIYLVIAEEIVKMIREKSDLVLNENIYITLTDHISMSLEREQKGIACENPLLMEIKQFYKAEYALAKEAAIIIQKHMEVAISEDEIGFITLHIVNASMNQQMSVTMKASRMIPEIINIVEDFWGISFEEDSFQYNRFVRHLQFFVRRLLDPLDNQEEDNYFYKLGVKEFPKAYQCVKLIKEYVKSKVGRDIKKSEMGYLIYHIVNITKEETKA